MNKDLFASMREQMCPSSEARAALEKKLVNTKSIHLTVRRYAAIAACAAVIAAAVPVYNFIRDSREISIDGGHDWQAVLDHFKKDDIAVKIEKPHSYILLNDPAACWPEDTADTGGSGDEDQDMTPGELRDNMLEAGFVQEDADAYLASGWQMTWAMWWKFYRQSEETGDRTLEALLDFSRTEMLDLNTGETELPGGAYASDAPDQSDAVMAYQNLMAKFEADYGPDCYPEWYGGAYIDEHAGLIVNIAEYYEPEDKALFFQIQDWAGSDKIGFGSSQLSMNQLRALQDKVTLAMEKLGIDAGCGINEETGQVTLDLPYATEEILWKLAELDPADTAIEVRIGYYAEDTSAPAPSVSHSIQPGGEESPGLVEDAIPFDD